MSACLSPTPNHVSSIFDFERSCLSFSPSKCIGRIIPIKTLATQVAFYFALQISIEIDTAQDAKLNKQSSLDTALLGISHKKLDTLLR